MLALWLLIGRALGLELRGHFDHDLVAEACDSIFIVSSLLLTGLVTYAILTVQRAGFRPRSLDAVNFLDALHDRGHSGSAVEIRSVVLAVDLVLPHFVVVSVFHGRRQVRKQADPDHVAAVG